MNGSVLAAFSLLCVPLSALVPRAGAQSSFTLEEVMSAPFPSELTAAKSGNRVAWVFDREGRRNIWVAEGPEFQARQLTKYATDDGQELSGLDFSADGNTLAYVRGGPKNTAGQVPNPTSNPAGAEQAVWTVSWTGGEPKRIDAGSSPKISAQGMIAYVKDGQIWLAPLGEVEKPQQLVVRGRDVGQEWSPDGKQLAFMSARGDHSFIAVYDVAGEAICYPAPPGGSGFHPKRSPDGRGVGFVRRPAATGGTA